MADNQDAHSLLCALKEMALQLGRTPCRDEFIKIIPNCKRLIEAYFGSYTVMVHNAGLDTPRSKKIDNSIFNKNIDKHIQIYEENIEIKKVLLDYPTGAFISDIHWPFSNSVVINRFLEYVGDVKPEWICLNGDAWDMYSHTKFPRTHNLFTPREEQNLARTENEKFWGEVIKRAPQSKKYQMLGNHDIRPLKRIMESYPEAEDWVTEKINSLFTFKDVITIYDPRQELMIREDIAVHHGYRSKLGEHRDFMLMNSINGHTHRGGVAVRRIRGITLWELNSGLAGNPEAKGLTYTPQKITDWTPGFGILMPIGPMFVPC